MSTLNPNDYVYLWHPTQQFLDRNGKPLIGGYVMVNVAGTTGTPAQTYVDWNGTFNARKIMLDSLGRATCIVADSQLYDMYVYNKYNVLAYSTLNVCGTSGDGAGNLHFTSSDGSITITRNQNNVDLVVHADEKSFGKITGSGTNADNSIGFDTTQYGDINANDGTITLKVGQLYHITMALRIENSTPGDDIDYCNVLDNTSQHHYFSLDESQTVQFIDLSWDMQATSQYVKFLIDIPARYTIASASMYIHAVNSLTVGGGSSSDLPPSTPEDEGKVLTVDSQGDAVWNTPTTSVGNVIRVKLSSINNHQAYDDIVSSYNNNAIFITR